MRNEEYFARREEQKEKIEANIELARHIIENNDLVRRFTDGELKVRNLNSPLDPGNKSVWSDPVYLILREASKRVWKTKGPNSVVYSAALIVGLLRDQFENRRMKEKTYCALSKVSENDLARIAIDIGDKYRCYGSGWDHGDAWISDFEQEIGIN